MGVGVGSYNTRGNGVRIGIRIGIGTMAKNKLFFFSFCEKVCHAKSIEKYVEDMNTMLPWNTERQDCPRSIKNYWRWEKCFRCPRIIVHEQKVTVHEE